MTSREPQATPQTLRVRASRNTLCEVDLLRRHKNCADFGKAIFSGFAQSSLLNVAIQGVECEL